MRRIASLALVALVGAAIVYVILSLLGIHLFQRQAPTLEISITEMMTGRDFRSETDTLTLIDPAVEFETPISKVAFCYRLTSSAPITVTYYWMHDNNMALRRNAAVGSGLICTTMQKDSVLGELPAGNYQVMIFHEGSPLAWMSFVIRTQNKSG